MGVLDPNTQKHLEKTDGFLSKYQTFPSKILRQISQIVLNIMHHTSHLGDN